jgi:hypothetical protein
LFLSKADSFSAPVLFEQGHQALILEFIIGHTQESLSPYSFHLVAQFFQHSARVPVTSQKAILDPAQLQFLESEYQSSDEGFRAIPLVLVFGVDPYSSTGSPVESIDAVKTHAANYLCFGFEHDGEVIRLARPLLRAVCAMIEPCTCVASGVRMGNEGQPLRDSKVTESLNNVVEIRSSPFPEYQSLCFELHPFLFPSR